MDLNEVIAEVADLLRLVVGDRLILRTKLDPKLRRIHANPRQIVWLFVHLAIHAHGAMPVGGELTIATANVELDRSAANEASVSPGAYAQAQLTITAGGLNPQTMARELIQQAQGAITVRNSSGAGATMTVLLPALPLTREHRQGGGVILVVDDKPGAREFARAQLDAAGYVVLSVTDRTETASVLSTFEIDLMIAGVAMPEQEGLETIQSVRKSHPNVKIIAVVSGLRGGDPMPSAELLGADAVVYQPLTGEALLDAVRSQVRDQ